MTPPSSLSAGSTSGNQNRSAQGNQNQSAKGARSPSEDQERVSEALYSDLFFDECGSPL